MNADCLINRLFWFFAPLSFYIFLAAQKLSSNMDKKHGLNQLQFVTMDFNRQANERPFWVKFSNGKQTKLLTEGQDGSLVLKNSIVKNVWISGGFGAFVALFQKITKIVGKKVPVVKFYYNATETEGNTPNQNFVRFREGYSGTNCF